VGNREAAALDGKLLSNCIYRATLKIKELGTNDSKKSTERAEVWKLLTVLFSVFA